MSRPATVVNVGRRAGAVDGKGNALTIRIGDNRTVVTVRGFADGLFPYWLIRPDRPRAGRRPPLGLVEQAPEAEAGRYRSPLRSRPPLRSRSPLRGRRLPADPQQASRLEQGAPLEVEVRKFLFGRVEMPTEIRLLDGRVIWTVPDAAKKV
jgi:hypothetical protein